MARKRKMPKQITKVRANKYKSRQRICMSDSVRKEILERAVPKMLKHIMPTKCTFYDELGIQCTNCPLNTLKGGLHCDMRAVLAVLVDDIAKESKKKIPHIPLDPFIEIDGVYKIPSKANPGSKVAERFKDII
jgi:hypothetical protein